ncbi:MAG: CDP-diacylglycerol--glycerol-3-phosphate 3-phosphatidyltransferase [Thermodesulfobacteriota bacterium]
MTPVPKLLNLPNWLSLSRIAAVPVIILLLFFGQGGRITSMIAALVFLLAVLTDLVDGYLARRYQLVTNVGRFLDPLADKLLNSASLIMLIPLNRVPAWLVFLLIGREIAVTGLRGIAAAEGVVIAASGSAKQKTLTQNIAIFCLLWHFPLFGQNTQAVGMVLLYLGLLVAYWSGYRYFVDFYRVFQSQAAQKGLDKDKGK